MKWAWIAGCAVVAGAWTGGIRAEEADWLERIDLKGDFRLRYEQIDREGVAKRDRYRYRMRIGAGIDLYEDIEFVLSFATAADNPISRNVTFGANEALDEFGVDLAYVRWHALDELNLLAGKMKNPMVQPGGAQLIYDNDLNPGGVAAQYTAGTWFANAAVVWIEERAADDDSTLYHLQGGTDLQLGENLTLMAGAGFADFTNTVGNLPFIFALPAGNTVDDDGRYIYEYAVAEFFTELEISLGKLPLLLFAHYADNVEVSQEDTAFTVGGYAGKGELRGDWQAGWSYKDVEADAVVGSFTESDFAGGGTDVTGHVLKGRYFLRDGFSIGATVFLNEAGEYRGELHDYRRLQLDLDFKFD
jgi:hypothetical protein